MTFYDEIRELAKDRLRCECWNANWEQFLYVSGAPTQVVAGCKRCGRTYAYDGNTWTNIGGPAVRPQNSANSGA